MWDNIRENLTVYRHYCENIKYRCGNLLKKFHFTSSTIIVRMDELQKLSLWQLRRWSWCNFWFICDPVHQGNNLTAVCCPNLRKFGKSLPCQLIMSCMISLERQFKEAMFCFRKQIQLRLWLSECIFLECQGKIQNWNFRCCHLNPEVQVCLPKTLASYCNWFNWFLIHVINLSLTSTFPLSGQYIQYILFSIQTYTALHTNSFRWIVSAWNKPSSGPFS